MDWENFYSAGNTGPDSYLGNIAKRRGVGALNQYGFDPNYSVGDPHNAEASRKLVAAGHAGYMEGASTRAMWRQRMGQAQPPGAPTPGGVAAPGMQTPTPGGFASAPGAGAGGPAMAPMPASPGGFAGLRPRPGAMPGASGPGGPSMRGGLGYGAWGGRR